jgi:hypothetical protein
MSNFTLSHYSTTIQYTPSTYAFDNATTGWLASPTCHSTIFPNASFQIEWTGKGIHVDTYVNGSDTLLVSLDDGAFTQVQASQGSGLVEYQSLSFGSHNLIVSNPPGGNFTLTGYSLLDLEKLQEGYVTNSLRDPLCKWH